MARVAAATLARLPNADPSVQAVQTDDEDVLAEVESLLNE
jgi:hypothetical protein